jgi:thioredoxin-like negative regulator of GroEL
MEVTMRNYGRDDVDYATFYTDWMRRLAASKTIDELQALLHGTRNAAQKSARSHLRAIDATTSMSGQSARRAHTRNVTAAAGDYAIALRGAVEIHELFSEHAKGGGV